MHIPDPPEEKVESSLPLEKELIYRIKWLINLRWLASATTVLIVLVARYILKIPLPLVPLLITGGVVGLYNIIFIWYAQHLRTLKEDVHTFHSFANFQIGIDWIALIFLIHYTGGIESPLMFYFILHVVISAILLSRRNCFLQAIFASTLILSLAFLEYRKLIPHISFPPVLISAFYDHLSSILTYLFFFISSLFITAYLATSVSTKLRKRERRLVILENNLEKAYHELEEADKAKTQFVTMITHELRSPVATLQSILELLAGGYVDKLSPRQEEFIGRMRRRTAFLLNLVNDLLNLTSEKGGRVKKEPVKLDIKKIVKQVCDSVKTGVEQKRIKFDVDLDPYSLYIVGDEGEINLLFSNLITNAIKYTPPEGEVQVKVWGENDRIKAEVSDTGIGIPQEDVNKIFDEFYRAAKARKMVREGTGLGLPIVKRIVEDYGGEIQVESEPGKGTTFFFYLMGRHE